MNRPFLLAAMGMGVAVLSTWAQQSTPAQSPPTPAQAPAPSVSPQLPPPKVKQPMTEEQRAMLEQRLDAQWSKMSIEGKQNLMRLHRALTQMPADERKFIHERIERFLTMTPTERQRLRQNTLKWQEMTPEQRQQAREEFLKRRQEFEDKWSREHPGSEQPPSGNAAPAPPPSATTP
ncbi:MAG TPA: DUF3106 domain-containing protein [Verrucomicrobiae bacterium]|nr:DUF3106 domain-containing protein [Verrucomicrobiae bacterium]